MRVLQPITGTTRKEFTGRVSPKGQITIPIEIRRALKIKPKDQVLFHLEGRKVKITPSGSRLDASFRAVPSLKKPLSLAEMSRVASEEHADVAAKEGL